MGSPVLIEASGDDGACGAAVLHEAALLGLLGAVVASLIIGVSENLAATYIPWIGSELKIAVPLAIIFAVLVLKPSGLFGSEEAVRV